MVVPRDKISFGLVIAARMEPPLTSGRRGVHSGRG